MIPHCIVLFFTVVKEWSWPGSWPSRTRMLKFPLGCRLEVHQIKVSIKLNIFNSFFKTTAKPREVFHWYTAAKSRQLHLALWNEYDRVCVLEFGFQPCGMITQCTGRVAVCVCAVRSAGGRWLKLIKLQVTMRSESLPHIWRKTAVITRHLYTFPLAILFPHWYKNIPHLDPAQERESETLLILRS